MNLQTLTDSSAAWFLAFLAIAGVLAIATGSLMEGAISALVLVGLAFLVASVVGG